MKLPIIEGLEKYVSENNIRFHMPGHKGKNSLIKWSNLIPKIDVTEVDGTDNLHKPETIILESQRLAAKTFGAKDTLYSVNGTTGGIYAAITSVVNPGESVLIQRNSHRSIYNALVLGRINPVYIYPSYNKENKIVTGINPNEIEKILINNKDIKAVVVTYPTYFGICSDIKRISSIVHKYDRILIVDEAHGSHLKFSEQLPISAIKAGADISIQSTHKTLPAFTQSSMVHVGTDRIDVERLRNMMEMYQTTSPSYLLMASLDLARAYMQAFGRERIEALTDNINIWAKYLNNIDGIKIFDRNDIDNTFYDFDPTKFLIKIHGITGKALEKILRNKYNIQLEMADYYYGLALASVLDEANDLKKLAHALEDISKKNRKEKTITKEIDVQYIQPLIKMPIYQAFNKKTKVYELEKSKGKVSGVFIIPYPPGIPILSPGELITEEIINYIKNLRKENIQILGLLDNEKIKVIK